MAREGLWVRVDNNLVASAESPEPKVADRHKVMGDYGCLIYGGGTAFASASNPSAEVVDGTGVVAGRSNGVTLSATDGTITIDRPGDYVVELALSDFSCGAASGNVQFDVQKNGASFTTTDRMQVIRVAATAKAGVTLRKQLTLAKGDVLRTIVTSAAGNAITVTEGSLTVQQLTDSAEV
jgi:hypothetical protein